MSKSNEDLLGDHLGEVAAAWTEDSGTGALGAAGRSQRDAERE